MAKGETLRKELTRYGKLVADKRLVSGPGGNISARLGSAVYLPPSGYGLDEVEEDQWVEVDLSTGEVKERGLKPTCEVLMHLTCYRLREDVKAVIHLHPPISTGMGFPG